MLAVKTILHPTDFSACSDAAFHLACSLARDHGSRLVVAHVAEPLMALSGEGVLMIPPEADLVFLRDKVHRIRPQDPMIQVEYRVCQGEPAAEILRLAAETRCDLIVLGTHGRTGLARFLMGSVAEQILRKAACPVVTVKTPLSERRTAQASVSEPAGQAVGSPGV